MKRRDLLKSLTMAAGGALLSHESVAQTDKKAATKNPSIVPIRGLLRKDGKMVQPIQINIERPGDALTAVTKLDGTEIDRRNVPAGATSFEIYVKPVTSTQRSTIIVNLGEKEVSEEVELKPVRQMQIYVLPHSHHDLGYTDLQADVETKQINNIKRGIELARKTKDYPEGARFVWNLEVLWGADLYMKRGSESDRQELIDAVQKGWVGINGSYANELTGLCRPEELLQLFQYSGQLGKTCGVKVDSAMMSDVPGFSWGTVTAMSQAGIRYFSAAPNYFDRIGAFMVSWQDKPFWWVSPSGKEKILFWVPWTGYALSHVMKLGTELVSKYQDRMDDVQYPYDVSYVRWSGHGDNAEPDPELSDWIRDWNQKYEWPRFSIASTGTAFSAFERRYGNQLPQYRGDLTPYWEDGAGSSALETRMSRNAADRINHAEALRALTNKADYEVAEYAEAWRNVLLYSEHTWGAWNSVSDSENPFVKKQWDVKRAFAVDAERLSEKLVSESLGHAGDTSRGGQIEIFNSSSWARSEVVYIPQQLSQAGDHVIGRDGKPLPSQRLANGDLAFLVPQVPAFSSARYTVSKQAAHHPFKSVSFKDNVLDNGILQARIDPATGDVTELRLQSVAHNLVKADGPYRANQLLFLAGHDVDRLQSTGPPKITVEENGPLVVSVLVESSAPTCNSVSRRIRLVSGADYLELSNTVDKLPAALNSHPGAGGAGGEFAQRGSKESIQFAYPFDVPNGKMRVDIALGNIQPEIDQLPGSCKNWLPVGRWVDVSNDEAGVTWVTQDAPLIEVGEISATMLGSQTNPNIWRKRIEPTQTFFSWVMNNHWGTNYRAYQEGPVRFRYALRPHTRYDAAAATKLAIGLSEPLKAEAISSSAKSVDSCLSIEPSDVLAVTFKPSQDRSAWIVRLFGASGESRRTRVKWLRPGESKMWRSNLAEEKLEPIASDFEVAAWDLLTIRVEETNSR